MSYVARGTIRAAVLVVLLFVGGLVLTSCDLASGSNTAVLNAGSTVPPIVEYTFDYSTENVTDGRIEVVSEMRDDLGTVLSENGFRRGDVVSARIDSVSIERLSAPTFGYLTGADVYLGTRPDGPHIGRGRFSTDQESASLSVPRSTVTRLVQDGATKAFGRLRPDNPENVVNDRVEVVVYFRLKVKGL
jgi:hypothetical protein